MIGFTPQLIPAVSRRFWTLLVLFAPLFIYNPPGDRIEHYNSFLTVLRLELVDYRQNKHIGFEFGNLNFPVPTKLQHLFRSATRVHFEQRDALQVRWQLAEQAILFLLTLRIRLAWCGWLDSNHSPEVSYGLR